MGKEIVWVTGDTYEQIIRNSNKAGNYLPNRRKRFCTQFLKLEPIFWWCYLNLFECEDDTISMNIGYRFDEPNRKADDFYEFVKSTKNFGLNYQNWDELEWRDSRFPLRKDGVDNLMVKSYWAKKPEYVYPHVSNCVICFNHKEIELQGNFIHEPLKMQWGINQEINTGNRFNMHISLSDIRNKYYTEEEIAEQLGLFTCNCTD